MMLSQDISSVFIYSTINNFSLFQFRLDMIRMDEPLRLDILYRNSVITWRFGPYVRGLYTIELGETASKIYPMPPVGKRFNSYKGQTIHFRLKYESPEGWITYSPLLTISISEKDYGRIQWQRDSEGA